MYLLDRCQFHSFFPQFFQYFFLCYVFNVSFMEEQCFCSTWDKSCNKQELYPAQCKTVVSTYYKVFILKSLFLHYILDSWCLRLLKHFLNLTFIYLFIPGLIFVVHMFHTVLPHFIFKCLIFLIFLLSSEYLLYAVFHPILYIGQIQFQLFHVHSYCPCVMLIICLSVKKM